MDMPDKNLKDKPHLQKLLPIIDDLNKLLQEVTLTHRSHKYKETFFNEEHTSVQKEWLELGLIKVTSGTCRNHPFSATVKAETDPANSGKTQKKNEASASC
jgi:hypothetical protein